MNKLQVYGDRFFNKEGNEGGDPPAPPEKKLEKDIEAKLERLAHLESENKELIAARDKAKEAKRKEEEDKLKQKGELQKLLDNKDIELSEKDKTLEDLKTKADAFEQLRTAEIDEAKKSLGDKWLDEYANLSLPALRKTVTALKAQLIKIPGTDNGGGGDPPVVTLTPDQKKEAKQMYPYISEEKAYEYYMHNLIKMKVKEKK